MIQYYIGNVISAFDNKYNVLVHGCNCFNTMGAGIAKSIKERYPNVYAADLQTKKGDINKLGTIGIIKIKEDKYIINAYSQYRYNGQQYKGLQHADYNAIESCFKEIFLFVTSHNYSICIPKIGAGLANGNWNIIEKIINSQFKDYPIDVYYL